MLIGIDASRANRHYKTGPEWYSYYLIKQIARQDKKNNYILFSDSPLSGGLLDLTCDLSADACFIDQIFDKNGFQVIKSPYNNFKAKILKWPFYFFWTQGRLSLEMLFGKYDRLFIPAHTIPVIHPRKTLNTIHDIGFEIDRQFYKLENLGPENKHGRRFIDLFVKAVTLGKYGANSRDYLSWSSRYSVKHASKVIVPSKFTANELKLNYHADLNKIAVVPNGYNDSLYRKIDDKNAIKNVLNKYGIGQPYLLYVGRLESKKNTHSLVQAFGVLKQKHKDLKHKLVLIGSASYGYDEVNYMMHEYGLDRDVFMPGWIEEYDMPYFYNGADAFIYPSKYEGFGIPLLQAMACGTPIAASNSTSIPEVVGDAAFLFDPTNIQSIANAIEKLIFDESLKSTLTEKGFLRVKDFSWEKCARQILELLLN
jgi:glycosyltransferase involved in cell wall biosynthesis